MTKRNKTYCPKCGKETEATDLDQDGETIWHCFNCDTTFSIKIHEIDIRSFYGDDNNNNDIRNDRDVCD